MRARTALPRERHALRPAIKDGGPEGKLRGQPPPPHCRAPDLGDGRGLNPSPDEREPAARKYYSRRPAKTTRVTSRKRVRSGCWVDSTRNSTGRHSWRFELGSTASGGSGATSSARTSSAAPLSRSSRRTTAGA